jgi:hypothetical protein
MRQETKNKAMGIAEAEVEAEEEITLGIIK